MMLRFFRILRSLICSEKGSGCNSFIVFLEPRTYCVLSCCIAPVWCASCVLYATNLVPSGTPVVITAEATGVRDESAMLLPSLDHTSL